jgi:excisionase family DNA binding protein
MRPHIALDTALSPRPSARVATVAELLDCDETTIRRMIQKGQLQAHGTGKRGIRVYLDSVTAYQEARPVAASRAEADRKRIRAQRSSVGRAAHADAIAQLQKSGILP